MGVCWIDVDSLFASAIVFLPALDQCVTRNVERICAHLETAIRQTGVERNRP
jgi:hypothetical protein